MKLLHRVLLLGLMGWFSCVGAADVGDAEISVVAANETAMSRRDISMNLRTMATVTTRRFSMNGRAPAIQPEYYDFS